MKMPFGKHKGRELDEIPEDYLWWVLHNCDGLRPHLRAAIAHFLGVADTAPSGSGSSIDIRAVLRTWYASLARDYHPDRGGSDEDMKVVNECHKRLCELLNL